MSSKASGSFLKLLVFVGAMALTAAAFQNCSTPLTEAAGSSSTDEPGDDDSSGTGCPTPNCENLPAVDSSYVPAQAAKITANYGGERTVFECSHWDSYALKGFSTATIEYYATPQDNGLQVFHTAQVARRVGYNGVVGQGGLAAFLELNSNVKSAYDRETERLTRGPIPATLLSARLSGYKGIIGCGGYSCWQDGTCDEYGRAYDRVLDYDVGSQNLTSTSTGNIYQGQVSAGYAAARTVFECSHWDPAAIAAMPDDVIAWWAQTNTHGLLNFHIAMAARRQGYNGPIGNGGIGQFMSASSERQAENDAILSGMATNEVLNAIAAARSKGYKGILGCGNANCFDAGQCDEYGRLRAGASW